MSALMRIADSSRTSREVRFVTETDSQSPHMNEQTSISPLGRGTLAPLMILLNLRQELENGSGECCRTTSDFRSGLISTEFSCPRDGRRYPHHPGLARAPAIMRCRSGVTCTLITELPSVGLHTSAILTDEGSN